MNGPYPLGTLNASFTPMEGTWETYTMKRGQRYRVTRSFEDADGDNHSVGEEWEFLSAMFSRFEDLLSLCVRIRSQEEWVIPLIWTPDRNEAVLQRFRTYVTEIE
jgi:hypothetical protein